MSYNPPNPNGQETMANSQPVVIASDQSPIPVTATPTGTQDVNITKVGGNSVTTAVPVSAASLPLPTGAATAALQTQPGVDIGDVTINNGAGAAAVNIQDGGNSITVDGTVAATQSGSWSVTAIAQPGIDIGDVTVNNAAGASAVNIQDGGNSITVDGTVALSSGSSVIGVTGVTQGSTTSGQSGDLVQGAVTTSNPTYTTAQTSPLSLDTSGNLRTVNGSDLAVTGQSAQTATVNNILTTTSGTDATDLLGYRSGTVQVVSTGTGGTYIFEGSNNNTNFQTIPVWSQLILTGTPITAAITATNTQLAYTFPIQFRYIRLRIATTITGGSIQAFSKFSQVAWTPGIFQVAQATTANLQVTATQTGTWTARISGNAGAALDAAVGTLPTNNVANINVPTTGAGAACSMSTNASALTVVNIKASAGSIYGISVVNKTAGVIYIQTYNTAGTPTLGTSVISWFPVAASATMVIPPGALALANFATGIGIGASTTPTSTGTPGTAPDVVVWYK